MDIQQQLKYDKLLQDTDNFNSIQIEEEDEDDKDLYEGLTKSQIRQIKQEKQIFQTQMSEKLGDLESVIKMNNLKQVLLEMNNVRPTSKARKYRKLYKKLSILRKLMFSLLLILSFFEKPSWCDSSKYTNNCQYPIDDPTNFIPNSKIPFLNKYVFFAIQNTLLLFLLFNKFLKMSYLVENNHRKKRTITLGILVILIIIDNTIQMIWILFPINFSLFLCPIFYVFYYGRLRRVFRTYFKIMIKGFPLIFIQFFNLVLFAGFGRVIFQKIPEQENVFKQFDEALYQLLILQTTSNYPDIMMPFYIEYRWAPLFFITYLVLNYILLTNMLLGVFYTNFKVELSDKPKTFFLKYEDLQNSINRYHELQEKLHKTSESFSIKNTLNQDQDLQQSLLVQEENSGEKQESKIKLQPSILQDSKISSKSLKNSIKKDKKKQITEIDNDNNSQKSDESNDSDYMDEQEEKLQQLKIRSNQSSKRYSAQDIMHLAEQNFGGSPQKQSRSNFQIQKHLSEVRKKKNIKSKLSYLLFENHYFEIFMGILSLVNFLFLYLQQFNENNEVDFMGYANLFINTIFFCEGYSRIYVIGLKKFFFKFYYLFEFLVVNVLEICLIIYFSTTELWDVCQYLILTKIIRFFVMLNLNKSISIIYKSLISFFPYFIDLFGVLMIQFCIFSGLGQELLGGQYNTKNSVKIQDDPDYIYNNFNDLGSGFNLLFELIIINNWQVNTQTAVDIMGSKWYRLFFIAWYIVGVVLALNIMIAFIIDYLVNQWDKERAVKQKEKEKILMEKKKAEQKKQQDIKRNIELLQSEKQQQQELEQKIEQQLLEETKNIQQQLEQIRGSIDIHNIYLKSNQNFTIQQKESIIESENEQYIAPIFYSKNVQEEIQQNDNINNSNNNDESQISNNYNNKNNNQD